MGKIMGAAKSFAHDHYVSEFEMAMKIDEFESAMAMRDTRISVVTSADFSPAVLGEAVADSDVEAQAAFFNSLATHFNDYTLEMIASNLSQAARELFQKFTAEILIQKHTGSH